MNVRLFLGRVIWSLEELNPMRKRLRENVPAALAPLEVSAARCKECGTELTRAGKCPLCTVREECQRLRRENEELLASSKNRVEELVKEREWAYRMIAVHDSERCSREMIGLKCEWRPCRSEACLDRQLRKAGLRR